MSKLVSNQRKIDISEFPQELPNFIDSYEPKESLIKKWIINWILSSIKKNSVKDNDILPNKTVISDYLGVSVGTVQNAIRYVEDEGYLKSKQRLGTMISTSSNPISSVRKSTSLREKAILKVKKYLIQNSFSVGSTIPSTRKMSELIQISQNTTRLAYEYLCSIGILESKQIRGNESNWILIKKPDIPVKVMKNVENSDLDSLINKVCDDIKNYISKNYNIGDKIPSHNDLAIKFNVSIKTVHDAVKKLNTDGILLSRRGRYGTVVAQNPNNPIFEPLKENSIFSKAQDASFYSYQKVENQIITMINKEFNSGEKIPSMKELSEKFDVSTNTIRKALSNLAEQGYITFGRGRYGGTFVLEKPDGIDKQPYQWLSINPKYCD